MSAETLRRAAVLMRHNAEVATEFRGRLFNGEWQIVATEPGVVDEVIAVVAGDDEHLAWDHLRSWHPAVALAVADWLDEVAERQDPTERWGRRSHGWTGSRQANAVARAYLGESA